MSLNPPIEILLVDDKAENLIALEATLAPLGFRLFLATSGREALGEVLRHQFAAILLDVNMPEMNGFETASMIRRREKSQAIPIIFVSAVYTDLEHIQLGYQTGAIDYILKPYDPNIVRSKVAAFANLFRLNNELAQKTEALALEHAARRVSEVSLHYYLDFLDRLDHSIVWEMTEQRKYRFVSHRATDLLGFSMPTWFSENDFFMKLVVDEDRDLVRDTFARAFATGRDRNCEHRMVSADGRVLWFHTGVQIEKYDNAIEATMRGLSVDITPFREKHLQRRDLGFGRLVDANLLGHLFGRTDGTISQANDRFLGILGYSRFDLDTGELRWPRLTAPQDQRLDERALEQLRRGGLCAPFEKECVRKDGRKISVLFGAAMLQGSRDEFSGFLLPVSDPS